MLSADEIRIAQPAVVQPPAGPVSMPTTPVLPVVALAVGFARHRQSPAQAALLAEDQPFVDAERVPTR